MQQAIMTNEPARGGNAGDPAYLAFLERVRSRFLRNLSGGARLFTTTATGLWDVYLATFAEPTRQYHNCNACRHFIERFGGIVTIDESGATAPVVWHEDDAGPDEIVAIAAMMKALRRATVTGVFLSSDTTWGQPETGDWVHLHVHPTKEMIFRGVTVNAGQAMAEKLEDFKNVQRALEEFTAPMVAQACSLLQTDSLYRSEKVLGPAKWLADLHASIAAAKGRRDNIVWRAVAAAPAGFCHPRSSMAGTLLEDIAAGVPFEEVSRRFQAKMNPLKYQRPQAAPSAGNIAQAEKIIEQLGAAGSLERRYARVEEIEALWRPAKEERAKAKGAFGHLLPTSAAAPTMDVPAQAMTWERFARTILPGAKSIEAHVPAAGFFGAILTAVNPDAPPILQWDRADRRNPFSWYLYPHGSTSTQWSLKAGAWVQVTAVTLRPADWFGANLPHMGKGAVFVLEGARDLAGDKSGNALFPETLKAELHGIRSTIEAYSKKATLAGGLEASACGIVIQSEGNNVRVRVTDGAGERLEFRLDRWD